MLRRDGAAEALFAALGDVDRLVLLGDSLELRNRRAREVLEASEPFFSRSPRRSADRRAGDRRGQPRPRAGRALARAPLRTARPRAADRRRRRPPISRPRSPRSCPARTVEFAYPGIWLREDVYATHGHYLDVHMTVPTFERTRDRGQRAARARGQRALERRALAGRLRGAARPGLRLEPHGGAERATGAGDRRGRGDKVWRTLRSGPAAAARVPGRSLRRSRLRSAHSTPPDSGR